jgi:hypothetical protein
LHGLNLLQLRLIGALVGAPGQLPYFMR